ncbi:bifunctional phosphopantothenoylcysteine decarboxylase/phosphopantothenate--cysteine ligase CoaBC [Olsenella profusa]|uniref:Coenzyme A biosynthesis bifunctional protein CoaBC n=1 Tax=Olsenella profusa TaxID=138595 RepID=A0ABS2F0U1_9ACTN|nr:bifunctional phosphopantothenoylcysteine decarboxylase/phosphopantothenate--cysteine ligase CoaBC [Olsenella profusa]
MSAGAQEGEARAPHVLLAVCGGVAAYKACEVLRGLQKAGCEVRVTMTADAERFVGKATFEALSGAPVADDLYAYPGSAIPHVELARWADVALVVPATANVIAKMAHGIADDCLSTTLLACWGCCPVLVAPGMNVHMWQNPATLANVATLGERFVGLIGPDSGHLACGEDDTGKLAPVDEIVAAAVLALHRNPHERPLVCDLAGVHLTITAGPTHEAIDPVRYVANASTGKMGFALARAARLRGALVTLVAGPCALPTPSGALRADVTSAAEMHRVTLGAFKGSDAVICCAAVADYTPAAPADHKLKKSREHLDAIQLVETADVLADLCADKGDRVVVGFAAETDDLLAHAREKLVRKGADLIVANDVSRPESTFGADTNRVALVGAGGVEQLETMPLPAVADRVLDAVRDLLVARGRLDADAGTAAWCRRVEDRAAERAARGGEAS